jgi:hypothetical protein
MQSLPPLNKSGYVDLTHGEEGRHDRANGKSGVSVGSPSLKRKRISEDSQRQKPIVIEDPLDVDPITAGPSTGQAALFVPSASSSLASRVVNGTKVNGLHTPSHLAQAYASEGIFSFSTRKDGITRHLLSQGSQEEMVTQLGMLSEKYQFATSKKGEFTIDFDLIHLPSPISNAKRWVSNRPPTSSESLPLRSHTTLDLSTTSSPKHTEAGAPEETPEDAHDGEAVCVREV